MTRLPLYPAPPRHAVEDAPATDLDPECARCGLREGARTVCMRADGEPGGVLLVGDYPGRDEDAAGRPWSGAAGKVLRALVAKSWGGPVAFDVALRCAPGTREVAEKHVDACRSYLAAVLRDARPTRVVTLGSVAAQSVLGRPVAPLTTRRGHAWLHAAGGAPVPVFLVMSPAAALRNRFVRAWLEEDLAWALTAQLPLPRFAERAAHVVETAEDAHAAVAAIRAGAPASYDCETAGLMYDESFRLLSLSVTVADRSATYVWPAEALREEATRAPLREWLLDAGARKVGSNLKYDFLAVHAAWGVMPRGVHGDTRLWRRMLEPEANGKLAVMADLVGLGGHKGEAEAELGKAQQRASRRVQRYKKEQKAGTLDLFATTGPLDLGLGAPLEKLILADPADHRRYAYAMIPLEVLHRYNGRDSDTTAALAPPFEAALRAEPSIHRVWERIVGPATEAVAQIEAWGVGASRQALQSFDGYLAQQEQELGAQLGGFATGVNWDSPDQVAALLYDKLRLPVLEQTDTGKPSTAERVLERLRAHHELPGLILDHRGVGKMRGTYASGLLPHVRPDGRIHCNLKLDGARCVPAGELVLTSRGYLPVEQVRIGDEVVSHAGVPRRVTDAFQQPPQPIYRVRLSNGLELRTTGAHKYRTGTGWTRADELCAGDIVTAHSDPEEWRAVAEWADYEVSSWGRVRNRATGGARALHPKDEYGHLKVTLARNGAQHRGADKKDIGVHQLVARAFLGERRAGEETRHRDGIAWNNTVRNLCYGSARDNRQDAVRHGSHSQRRAGRTKLTQADVDAIRATQRVPEKLERNAAKLTPAAVREIRARFTGRRGEKASLARQYGVTQTAIGYLLAGSTWADSSARVGVPDAELAMRYGVTRETIRDVRSGKCWPSEDHIVGKRSEFFEARVTSVSVEAPEVSFALTVDVDSSHVTGGVVTHNSGRLSCEVPNLQNIPRASSVEGRMCRDVFVASPGCALVELDFSQLELRVAAALSGDEGMRRIFESGVDYHQRTAELICRTAWGVEPARVLPEHRSIAKQVNFGLIYGMGDHELARRARCTVATAARAREAILGQFTRLAAWLDEQVAHARRHGYVWTWWDGERARRRPIWRIADADEEARAHAENQAKNSPIQGTASDFCLASLVACVDWLRDDCVPAKLVLPVHDSLLFDAREDAVDEVVSQGRRIMEGWPANGVPIVADAKVGRSWGSMREYGKAA